MKRLLLPLTIAALVGLFSPLAAPGAHACSCVYRTPAERIADADAVAVAVVRDVAIESSVSALSADLEPGNAIGAGPATISLEAEGYLTGSGPTEIIVEQQDVQVSKDLAGNVQMDLMGGPNCALFNGQPIGERYLLYLKTNEAGGYYHPSWCAGSVRLSTTQAYGFPDLDSYVRQLDEYDVALGLPPGTLWKTANAEPGVVSLPGLGGIPTHGSDFPWVATTTVAILGPVAFLAGAAFVWRRGV